MRFSCMLFLLRGVQPTTTAIAPRCARSTRPLTMPKLAAELVVVDESG